MLKKVGKYLRYLVIFIGWSVFYTCFIYMIMGYFWHFNIFNPRYWKIIGQFWQSGGVIDQFSEYMFLLMLILIIPGWIIGFKKAKKLSYIKIIFFPVFWYNAYLEKKYASQPSHIVLKNMGGGKFKKQSPQQMMEAMISDRMPAAKEKNELNSSKIRAVFAQKNKNFHQKMNSEDN